MGNWVTRIELGLPQDPFLACGTGGEMRLACPRENRGREVYGIKREREGGKRENRKTYTTLCSILRSKKGQSWAGTHAAKIKNGVRTGFTGYFSFPRTYRTEVEFNFDIVRTNKKTEIKRYM